MRGERKKFLVTNPNAGSHKLNLINEKFGMLTVKSLFGLDKYKNKLWLCKCDCGNDCYVKTTSLRSGKTTSCKCNQYKKGEAVYNYTGFKEITGSKWYSIRQNALVRGLSFIITKEDVWELINKQNNKCALTGLNISFKESTASVDRIDNDKGYDVNNIQIVHKDVNRMRNDFSIDYFKEICALITNNKN